MMTVYILNYTILTVYKQLTAVTAGQLNAETFVNREPHRHVPSFQPTVEEFHYTAPLGLKNI